jgi:hypothetical protein
MVVPSIAANACGRLTAATLRTMCARDRRRA